MMMESVDLVDADDERKRQAKFYRDKYILETAPGLNGNTRAHQRVAHEYLGIDPQNFEAIKGITEETGSTQIIVRPIPAVLRDSVLMKLASKERGKATELIVDKILEENHIYTTRDDENSEMWIYQEGIYVPEARTFVKEYCREILGEAFTAHLGNEVIAKIEADTYIAADKFFSNNAMHEIAVQNGLLNVITREVRPFNPQEIFFNKLPIVYDPEQKCSKILEHLNNVLKDKSDVPVVLELFGYLLYKENKYEKAIMLCGTGRNGKGKTLELMKRFIGADNFVSIPLQQFETDPYASGELFNKMANIAGDIDSTAIVKSASFKTMTGRDPISAPRKFKTRVTFTPFAKQIFCANELPKTHDSSVAFWDRWILLEFPFTFVTQEEFDKTSESERKNYKIRDPDIVAKMSSPDEMSGLLNAALDALAGLLKHGDFSYSKSREEVKSIWMRKADSFMAFCMDYLEEDYDGRITKQELRRVYNEYCKANRIQRPAGDKSIKSSLTYNFGAFEDRYRDNNEQIPFWQGIRFKNTSRGMGGKDGKGFSICIGEKSSYTKLETSTNPTNLTEFIKSESPQGFCSICGSSNSQFTQDGINFYCDLCSVKKFGGASHDIH